MTPTGIICIVLRCFPKPLGTPEFPIHVKSLQVSPDPPKPGEDLTINAVGEASETVEVCLALTP